jgi:hypothetical protein
MGFTKLDERILQSSIMAENPVTFKVWITLLAACEANGIAYVSAIYLSSICHLPLSRVEDSIKKLEGPDPHSRSLQDDGRRIRRVDGGFEIINYTVYRDLSLKDAEAERKRLYRLKIKDCPDRSGRCPDPSASASASASGVGKSGEKGKIQLILDEHPKRWEGITDEDKALWAKTYPGPGEHLDRVLQEMIAYWDAQPPQKRKVNWKRAIVNRLRWLQDHGSGQPRSEYKASQAGAHPPASSAEKDISRKVEEFARSLWKEAEPALSAARGQGQKAFTEANEKVQREVERKIVEYRKQLIKGGQS